MTRVRVSDSQGYTMTFASMKEATSQTGLSVASLRRRFKVERIYEKGYWSNFDKEFLKSCGKANSPEPRCLLIED